MSTMKSVVLPLAVSSITRLSTLLRGPATKEELAGTPAEACWLLPSKPKHAASASPTRAMALATDGRARSFWLRQFRPPSLPIHVFIFAPFLAIKTLIDD